MAKGPTPARMLPQLGVVSTFASAIKTWANRKSTSMPGSAARDTIATLLVSGLAPPMPSIWRGSGEPIDRTSVVAGKGGAVRIYLGGRRILKKKKTTYDALLK